MSKTIKEAIDHMESTGKSALLRHHCIKNLAQSPSATASELAYDMQVPRDHISPRLAELQRLGLACVVGTRPCRMTGRTCQVWALGGTPQPKRETAFERGYKAGYIAALQDLSPSEPPSNIK